MPGIHLEKRCRVCGLEQSEPPWGEDGCTPSFDICDCCGTEFGYEDCLPVSARKARAIWLSNGCPWFQPDARPEDWSAAVQLQHVPKEFL